MPKPTFYEFFAGAGMARAGLGSGWECVFANDFDKKKGLTYQHNWGAGSIEVRDIRKVDVASLPGKASLAWASFPCQDLSLAGGGAGLRGERSGTFYPFWDIMRSLDDEGRPPDLIALENVNGTLTSHGGKDFTAICKTFSDNKYRFGAVVVDASLFVPQSRPRLFVIGVKEGIEIDRRLITPEPTMPFHTRGLRNAVNRVPVEFLSNWIWWNLPIPPRRTKTFADIIEENPVSVEWHTQAETAKLLGTMTPVNLAKVEAAKRAGRRMVGGVYKRTRAGVVRAEVRFDDVAGCLRTPAGGSSRQTIMVVDGNVVRSRLISTRETARLMGLPEGYKLPMGYNEAYHLTGDGVAVPAVRWLARHLLEPLVGVQLSSEESSEEIHAA